MGVLHHSEIRIIIYHAVVARESHYQMKKDIAF